ncbi:CPBP family intramembrane metalloprotease [Mycolicibacillus parakoreensis]|uniref:CPBP family intramembrane metalloprotease n=1 Tax=Mycolicibacillus parakoreensis TaxID=1069221 RepID=A0ABY3U6I1_9MYCO|nr:CPBP family intramembrane glutamic endopeptidase [Mycolicibacillus parakoreensis]MCV7315071.1 CPBP family intramembrane metalloprotease [Mycolicibacillus parakoreensis]ULN53575.1 CPBP family intramembrane metalloprotease [Mycolicibacillus parakoreensis]
MSHPSTSEPGLVREFLTIITNIAVPHNEPPSLVWRRRVVVAVVLVAGALLLGWAMRHDIDDPAFAWSLGGLAVLWAVGALLSGPLHLGTVRFRGRYERPVFTGTGIGVVVGGLFVLGAWATRQVPAVAEAATGLVGRADESSLRLLVGLVVLNAIAEEMFFRGAVYTAVVRFYPLVISTVLYTAVIAASGNWLLVVAAVILGTVCGVERRATNGVLAPVLTHLVWGLVVVLVLPSLFGG